MKEPICHCGESGYYHCSVLREKLEEMRKVIRVIIDADALRDFAYERGDDPLSIRELCNEALKWPGEDEDE